MSLIFSAELAGSVSGSSEPECAPSPSARSIPTAAASSPSTGQLSLFSETSEPLPAKLLPTPSAVSYGSNRGGGMGRVGPIRHSLDAMARKGLISSAVGSPAKMSRSQERTRAFAASAAAYGRSTPELLARFDRATSSWRTSQLCLDGELSVFSETWPRSGLMRNGTAYQLPPLVRLTDATGSGSWPTPTANLYEVTDIPAMLDRREACKAKNTNGNGFGLTLQQAVAVQMWPTPQARDWKDGNDPRDH